MSVYDLYACEYVSVYEGVSVSVCGCESICEFVRVCV